MATKKCPSSSDEEIDSRDENGVYLYEYDRLDNYKFKLPDDFEVSMEDHVKDRNHIAKIRSLLFRHELKSKRINEIKSNLNHRLKNKDPRNSALGALMDPEMAMKQEEARGVEERMTLKHKNTGKWAKRMISRGLNVKYDGTRRVFGETEASKECRKDSDNFYENSDSDNGVDGLEDVRESKLSKQGKTLLLNVLSYQRKLIKRLRNFIQRLYHSLTQV